MSELSCQSCPGSCTATGAQVTFCSMADEDSIHPVLSGPVRPQQDLLIAVGYLGLPFQPGAKLFRRTDVLSTGTWVAVHGAPLTLPHAPLYAIVRLPSAPNQSWFVAGDVGVFRTDDGGTSWANATAPLGLPNTLVRDLRLSGDGNTLYAATFGRGVWSMDLHSPPNLFSIRGIVTQGGRPVARANVVALGVGRIKRFL